MSSESGKSGPAVHTPVVRVVDRGVTRTATGCSSVEDGPVGSQDARSYFERSMVPTRHTLRRSPRAAQPVLPALDHVPDAGL